MKTLTIYTREILERTGFRKYPYKEVTQVTILYDNKEFKNHSEDISNSRLKIPFNKVIETRSSKVLNDYLNRLHNTTSDKFIKNTINSLIV